VFSYAAISRRIAKKLGLRPTDVATVCETIRARSWFARNGPGLLGVTTLLAWVVIFGRGTDMLEKTRFDLLGTLHTWGIVGDVLAFALGWGVGLLLAGAVAVLACQRMFMRRIRAMPRDGHGHICVCEECLYPMAHVACGQVSRCPECGSEYFRREESADSGRPRSHPS
jgi:hypothetical protein